MARELIIYADESTQKGKYFSNFYGGALVRSTHLHPVRDALHRAKIANNLYGEIKWSKVTAHYLDKYKAMVDQFFTFIRQDQVKIRIMFTQNYYEPVGLDAYQREHTYQLLYYQFIKHAFGLRYSSDGKTPTRLRIYLDKLPDTKEKNAQFKAYLASLEKSTPFRRAAIRTPTDQIAEVDSRKHDILQCLDIILGAMQFRLNDLHKAKPPGRRRRGKRTIAKEKLYKHIYHHICQIHPNFNIGVSTGKRGDASNYWRHPYRHWLFIPSEFRRNEDKTKN